MSKTTMTIEKTVKIFATVVAVIAVIYLLSLLVGAAWNAFVPAIFHAGSVNDLQAFILTVLLLYWKIELELQLKVDTTGGDTEQEEECDEETCNH